MTDADGRYRFVSIKPGPSPGATSQGLAAGAHPFLALRQRAGAAAGDADVLRRDPLFAFDPIFQSVPDVAARERLVRAPVDGRDGRRGELGYVFDIVLRGRDATPFGHLKGRAMSTENRSPPRRPSARSRTRAGAGRSSPPRRRPARGRPSASSARSSTATASPSATPCSKPGRPPRREAEGTRPMPGFRRVPSNERGEFRFELPARSGTHRWPTSRCSRAACSSTSSARCSSKARPASLTRRCWRRCRPSAARR